jgi:hypothetical protein
VGRCYGDLIGCDVLSGAECGGGFNEDEGMSGVSDQERVSRCAWLERLISNSGAAGEGVRSSTVG